MSDENETSEGTGAASDGDPGHVVAVEVVAPAWRLDLPETTVPEKQIETAIMSYLVGKDIGRCPLHAVNQAVFPGQRVSFKFERVFRAVVNKLSPIRK